MKKIYILILFAFSIFVFPSNINAQICSKDKMTKISSLINNIKITYEHTGNNEFKINIYNIPKELYVLAPSQKKFYYNDNSISIDTHYNGGMNYIFKIYSSTNDECINEMDYSKSIYVKKYNKYSEKDVCKVEKYINFKYCNQWYQGSINDNKFISELKKYEQSLENDEEIITEDENNNVLNKKVIIYFLGTIMLIIIITIILVIRKRKRRAL